MDYISVREADFNVQQEYDALSQSNTQDGAVVLFVGRVRDLNLGEAVFQLELEHYPEMADKALSEIVAEAHRRWPLGRVRVIHRVGKLLPADQIVLVGTTSPHRQAAFESAEYIMDVLKTRAPFWKKESTQQGEQWVEARSSDDKQADRW